MFMFVWCDDVFCVDCYCCCIVVCEFGIVCDEYECCVVCVVQFEYQVDDCVVGGCVEVVGWFVGEQDCWMCDECVCECDVLLFVV